MLAKMSRPYARTIALALGVLLGGACSSVGKLTSAAPQNVDLSGTWKLNRAASDDPGLLMQKMHGRSRHMDDEAGTEPPASDESRDGGTHGAGHHRGSMPGAEGSEGGGRRMRYGGGMLADVLGEFGRGHNVLLIEQHPTEMRIDNGVSSRKLTPGDSSVVSVASGVADQHSGWHGHDYLIETKGENRPTIVERYSLSPDHRQLIVDVKIEGNGRSPSMELKRVYDTAPAAAAAAARVPST
jgi:hypothetical protein